MENLRYFAALYGIAMKPLRPPSRPSGWILASRGTWASIPKACGSASRWRARSFTLLACCCWTSPFPTSILILALQIAKLLAVMRDEGATIMLVTHQTGLLSSVADEYIIMSRGQLADRGAMQRVHA